MNVDLNELASELDWLAEVLDRRLRRYFAMDEVEGTCKGSPRDRSAPSEVGKDLPEPPDLTASGSPYAEFVREHAGNLRERLALVLALAGPLRPQLLDVFFAKNATFDRRFTEFGGVYGEEGFEPTGETLAFILGGSSIAARVAAASALDAGGPLIASDVLRVEPARPGLPPLKGVLRLSPDHLALFTTGEQPEPVLGPDFPAQRIETALEWDDLILHPVTKAQVEEVATFDRHGETLMQNWGMAARLRPGLRVLFYGPPGSGKTLCVTLLGKRTERAVYRVDLSLVVSKYIGETEKNLARVFERARNRRWILFFDEAEALFGKRSETKDAHDRYANQEIAYLLQRIESFDGIAVLASNLRENLDDAFTRRFELIVYFPMPRPQERLEIWRRGFSPKAKLAADVDQEAIARGHELSGGSIMNVIRRVSLASIAENERPIVRADIEQAIRRELANEGRLG